MERRSLILVGVVALGGCAKPLSTLKEAGPASVPNGWTTETSLDGEVTLGVPTGYTRKVMTQSLSDMGIGSNEPGAGAAQAEMDKMTGGMDTEREEEQLKKGIKLRLYVTGTKPIVGEVPTGFYVKKETQPGYLSLEEAGKQAKSGTVGLGTGRPVDLPIGKALLYEGEAEMKDGTKKYEAMYVMMHNKDLYKLCFVTQADPTQLKAIHADVAKTLRLKLSVK